MSALAGLDLAGRAALLGVSCREYVRLGQLDPRNVADAALETTNARAKLCAWVDAGEPDVDVRLLDYKGHPEVRRILEATLATLPMAARWLAMRVLWVEIGRGDTAGHCSRVLGEPRHVIMLNGATSDDLLPAVIAHELAHSMHFPNEAAAPRSEPPMPEDEWFARLLVAAATEEGDPVERAVRWEYRTEVLANDLARAWGYPSSVLVADADRVARLRAQLVVAGVRELAERIAADIDQRSAACELIQDARELEGAA